jgi:hypothetical protein
MTLMVTPSRRQPPRPSRTAKPAPRPVRSEVGDAGTVGPPLPPYRLTVDQYHRMIDAGILEEGVPVELLDGWMEWKDRSAAGEDPMTVGDEHSWSVDALTDLKPRLARLGCHLRVHQPVTFPPHHEPEPDISAVLGDRDTYAGRKPGPDDILWLIEVSDSSLTYDRTTKLRIYADAGVKTYLIVNLPDRAVEVYTQPVVGRGRYATAVTLTPKDKLTFPTVKGKGLTVPVKSLLPPAQSGT